jgi:hypothetical protein
MGSAEAPLSIFAHSPIRGDGNDNGRATCCDSRARPESDERKDTG